MTTRTECCVEIMMNYLLSVFICKVNNLLSIFEKQNEREWKSKNKKERERDFFSLQVAFVKLSRNSQGTQNKIEFIKTTPKDRENIIYTYFYSNKQGIQNTGCFRNIFTLV